MKAQSTVTNEVMRTKTDHKKIAELIGRGWTDFQIYKNSGWSMDRIDNLRQKLLLHAETKKKSLKIYLLPLCLNYNLVQ